MGKIAELRRKLDEKKAKMLEKIEKGKEISRQREDEHRRKKIDKIANMKQGARKTIAEGILLKKSVTDVMKETYSDRKYARENKFRDKGKDGSGSD